MSIFSGIEKEKLGLVFDIGSSSVGGALFYMQKSGIPKIIFSTREPIILEDQIDVDRFLALTLQSLHMVANKVYKAGLGAPKQIFCVLSSPWHISQTRIISYKKNTPFIFTAKLAEDLIKKEIGFFEEEHKEKYLNDGGGIRSIECKNIKTMLNGYGTMSPLNQKAKELEMTIFISMSGEQILRKIEETIQKFFHFKDIKFCSFVLASFTAVRDLSMGQENFLLIDIGGEVTDISMIKKNILRESISFPSGQNFLIRGIALAFGCTFDEARSMVAMLKEGHASVEALQKLEPVVSKLRNEWLRSFQETLAALSTDVSIPSDVYLTVDADFVDFFSETIKSEQLNQYILTDSKFKLTFMDANLFHGLATFEDKIIRDSFLLIDSVYISRFLTKI